MASAAAAAVEPSTSMESNQSHAQMSSKSTTTNNSDPIDSPNRHRIIRIKRKASETWTPDPNIHDNKKFKFVGSIPTSKGCDVESIKELLISKNKFIASQIVESTSNADITGKPERTSSATTSSLGKNKSLATLAEFDEDFDDLELMITDYEDFVFSQNKTTTSLTKEKIKSSLPKQDEVIDCNGIPLIAAPTNIGVERREVGDHSDDDDNYIYDVYLYDPKEDEKSTGLIDYKKDPVLVAESRESEFDTDYRFVGPTDDDDPSSNDEDYPGNDYPDEDDYDYNEYDFYREWEYDETREMMRAFESNCINPRDLDDDDDDEGDHCSRQNRSSRRYDESSDEEWASKED